MEDQRQKSVLRSENKPFLNQKETDFGIGSIRNDRFGDNKNLVLRLEKNGLVSSVKFYVYYE